MKRYSRQIEHSAAQGLLVLANYHWLIVCAISGIFAIGLAYSSYNLFHLSMANVGFIRQHGLLAIQEGALLQTLQILVVASFALACYFGFKICESELLARYRRWSGQ